GGTGEWRAWVLDRWRSTHVLLYGRARPDPARIDPPRCQCPALGARRAHPPPGVRPPPRPHVSHRRVGSLARQWQADGEGAALTLATLDADGATVLLDDFTHGGQADAHSAHATDVPGAVEPLENVAQVGDRNAHSLVAHGHDRPGAVIVLFPHAHDRDDASIRAVLDGIAEEVVHDSLQAREVPLADQLRLTGHLDEVPPGSLLVLGSDAARHVHQVHRLSVQVKPATQLERGD